VKIKITVKPGAKQNAVEKTASGGLMIAVKERAIEGRANKAVLRSAAEYFNIAPSRVKIVSGFVSRKKIIEVS
jgi:uncharacterized protein YggU (UPF0235/DUF167 family)